MSKSAIFAIVSVVQIMLLLGMWMNLQDVKRQFNRLQKRQNVKGKVSSNTKHAFLSNEWIQLANQVLQNPDLTLFTFTMHLTVTSNDKSVTDTKLSLHTDTNGTLKLERDFKFGDNPTIEISIDFDSARDSIMTGKFPSSYVIRKMGFWDKTSAVRNVSNIKKIRTELANITQ